VRALAVIPARGGSREIPAKNIRPLAGEPLLVHTIRAAQAATLLDRVVVSTDSEEIAAIARDAGVEVVRRPPELARDESPTEDALIHAVQALGVSPDYVVTLEPTSPLRTPARIDHCIELALARNADSVVTVVETREVLGRLDGELFRRLDPDEPRRRQDRTPLYREAGAVYVTRTSSLVSRRSVLAEPLYAVVVPEDEAIDINTPLDFLVAEAALRAGSRAEGGVEGGLYT
jgi:CMP-N-acetylneuraminic acid synthetase